MVEQVDRLLSTPVEVFELKPSRRWKRLCEELREYQRPSTRWSISPQRKWELASALQKAVRRGDRALALQVIAAIDSIPDEWPYFWRRLPIIACEDIGVGDIDLTILTVAAVTLFRWSSNKDSIPAMFSFFIERMCTVPVRSRSACDLVGISSSSEAIPRNEVDAVIFGAIRTRKEVSRFPSSKLEEWRLQNNWRSAGQLIFLDLDLPFAVEKLSDEIAESPILDSLPSCAFDMYTRCGRSMLRQLVSTGSSILRQFIQVESVRTPIEAVGEALFFAEGGRLRGEMVCEAVRDLRHHLFAQQFNLTDEKWQELRLLLAEAVKSGLIDDLREDEVNRRSAQGKLFE